MLLRGQLPSAATRSATVGFAGSGFGARGCANCVTSKNTGPTPPGSDIFPSTARHGALPKPLGSNGPLARAFVNPPRVCTRLLLLLEVTVKGRPVDNAVPLLKRQPRTRCETGPSVA